MIPIAAAIPILAPIIERIIDRALPDEGAREAAKASAIAELATSQAQIDLAQAQHPSLFVAGARPAMVWAAAMGVAWQFVLQPVLGWGLVVAAWWTGTDAPPPPPQLDVYELIALVGGGTGLYALRGVEKKSGVARDSLDPDPLAQWRAAR